jgi:hypothetical protein
MNNLAKNHKEREGWRWVWGVRFDSKMLAQLYIALGMEERMDPDYRASPMALLIPNFCLL